MSTAMQYRGKQRKNVAVNRMLWLTVKNCHSTKGIRRLYSIRHGKRIRDNFLMGMRRWFFTGSRHIIAPGIKRV